MASMRNLLKNAIMAVVAASEEMTDLLAGRFYWGTPPANVAKPYMTIETLGGERLQAMKACAASSGRVVIYFHVFSDGGKHKGASTEAESVLHEVHGLFDMQAVSMTGYKPMTVWRGEEDNLVKETDTGLWHGIATYQGRANPAA